MATVVRTPEEIDNQRGEALLWTTQDQTDLYGMSYEQGVEAALAWVLGEEDEEPITTAPEDEVVNRVAKPKRYKNEEKNHDGI